MIIDKLAALVWNPFLVFMYSELGVLFLVITGGIALTGSWRVIRKSWDMSLVEKDERIISPTRAFITSIAANVGVGNLAGVATAIHLGGPGALFWIWVSGIFGMSFRLCSVYLGCTHNPKDKDAKNFATPMAYIGKYFTGKMAWVPTLLAGLIMVKGLMTANLIQSNSVAHAIEGHFGLTHIVVAILLSAAVAAVTIGGVQRIVNFSISAAPWMILIYVSAGLFILLSEPARTLTALNMAFTYAFTPYSIGGGIAGYTVMQAMQLGTSRGILSHGSGLGIEPFLQSANHHDAARNGFIAAFVPVVDTLVICSITGLVIISTGLWGDVNGAALTLQSFQLNMGPLGKFVIIFSIIVFAFTTIISWSYYSEKCFKYLGGKNIAVFRWLFVSVTFIGPFFPVKFVWSMGDLVIGAVLMAHLLPLAYATIRNITTMRKDLAEACKKD